jgi:hypothetical protein
MIHGVKLRKLLEQTQTRNKYRNTFRSLLGISENAMTGEPVIDPAARAVHPIEVSLQEVAYEFLGRDYRSTLPQVSHLHTLATAMEAQGGTVLPSHFANISAFVDTVGGLIDAMVMESYQSPEFIGDSLCTVIPARVNGGKMIGVGNDGRVGTDLLPDQPYPTVGLKETYVDVPDNVRNGVAIQVNEQVFIYDRTDQVQSAAQNAGYAVRRNKEIRQADCVLGITNTYSRDGNASNTYLTSAGAVPNQYINSSTNPIVDIDDFDDAFKILNSNVDPLTGFEIVVPVENATVLVSPYRIGRTQDILRAQFVERNTQTAAVTTRSPNRLSALNVTGSVIWYNRLITASVNATNANGRWHMGDFAKAFGYRQVWPFAVVDAPLSSEDVRRDIVLSKVARELGVPFTREPRYVYQGTVE